MAKNMCEDVGVLYLIQEVVSGGKRDHELSPADLALCRRQALTAHGSSQFILC